MRNFDLYTFDWSGTLSDDRIPVYEANMRILKKFDKSTMPFKEWLSQTPMTPIEFLKNQDFRGDTETLLALYKKFYDDVIDTGARPHVYPDAFDTLQLLHSNKKGIAILSSHPEENLKKEAGDYNVSQFITLIKGNSTDKAAGLKTVCKEMGVDMSHALYIGDTIYDIRAAKGAGVNSAGIAHGYHSEDRLKIERPDFIFNDLSDFKNRYIKSLSI